MNITAMATRNKISACLELRKGNAFMDEMPVSVAGK
jgi:hypothetical protein